MSTSYVVGVDLGGTKIRAVLASISGRVVHEVTLPTAPNREPEAMLDRVASAVVIVRDAADVVCTAVCGAGVVTGDQDSFTHAPNLGGLVGEEFSTALEARLGHPVVLENDVNAAAIGELHHGAGRSQPTFAFVAAGTGIGMGIIIDRQLIRGTRGAAGEIGYLPFGADPTDRANHQRGPLEEVLAGHQISRTYMDLTGAEHSTREVFALAESGDAAAQQTLGDYSRHLARAIVAVKAVIDPGLFVLGGGVGSRVELIRPIHGWLDRYGHSDVDVRTSELGTRAGVVGAVEIAREAAHTQHREELKA